MTKRPYDYVAYIDESGDTGLSSVKPFHPQGSSEWFVIAATLVRAERENEVVGWVKDIFSTLPRQQRKDLHFRKLNEPAKLIVADAMAGFPARYFVMAANKKNMVNYRNEFARTAAQKYDWTPTSWNWFYYWAWRVLLEKVTDLVLRKSLREFGEPRVVRLEFSENASLHYGHIGKYYDVLKLQARKRTTFIQFDEIKWQVLDRDQIFAYRPAERAGLQLADSVAGAFFAAVDDQDTGRQRPEAAFRLRPRMARRPNGVIAGYGVKLRPGMKDAKLKPTQSEFFEKYGYPNT